MAVKILITTSIRSLGELIQQALQETGHYRAELVGSGEQALELAPKEKFSLAIVDFGAVPDPVEFIVRLRETIPEIHIVAMPFNDGPEPSEIDDGLVNAWLSMPFYLPNLLETLEEIIDVSDVEPFIASEVERQTFPSAIPKKTASTTLAPEWLQDVNRVAQHLTRLSLESTAQAALITRGSQLWAYAGQLPQNAAEELAHSVAHYWAHDGGSDLARFIRLDATNTEYMMYATSLGGDYVLALAFETEMPFTEMRVHAGQLAHKLSHPPQDEPEILKEDSVPQPAISTDETLPASPEQADDSLPPIPPDWRPDQDVAEGRQAFFEELLTSMEIPEPNGAESNMPLNNASPADTPAEFSLDEFNAATPTPFSEETVPSAPYVVEIEIPPESLAETRPTTVIEETTIKEKLPSKQSGELEYSHPSLHKLTYACVLVPRLPRHHLVGDIATYLTQWVAQLSLAYGWRLEHLAIRPD